MFLKKSVQPRSTGQEIRSLLLVPLVHLGTFANHQWATDGDCGVRGVKWRWGEGGAEAGEGGEESDAWRVQDIK